MKKLSLILCVALLLGSLIPFTVSAETTDLDSYLVRHYDFSTLGTGSIAGRPINTVNNNKYDLYNPNTTIENGFGIVNGTNGSYYKGSATDGITTLSDMTVVMKFSANGTIAFSYVMRMTKIMDVYIDSNGVNVRVRNAPTGTETWTSLTNQAHSFEVGDLITVAVSLDWTGSSLNSKVFFLNDDEKSYTVDEKSDISTTTNPSYFETFYLGKASDNGAACTLGYSFDDLCIYSKALSEDDIKTLWNIPEDTDASINIAGNLKYHYNFSDAITAGQTYPRPKDVTYTGSGTKYSFYGANFTLDNGVAYLPYSKSEDLSDVDKLQAMTDATAYLVFKPEGTTTGNFGYALQIAGLVELYVSNAGMAVRTNGDSKPLTVNASGTATPYAFEMGKYYTVAISMDWNDAKTELSSTVYISDDNGKNFTSYSTTVETAKNPSTATKITLGVNAGSKESQSKVDFYYDDLRIYDKALSQREVESITIDKSPSVAPHHISMQSRTNTGNYDVRFCAALDHLNYSEVGFEIIATDADGKELDRFEHATKSVYESVLALGEPVTANDICEGSKYLIAYAVLQIPDNLGTVIFNVRTYGTDTNGTFYSDTVTFTFNGSAHVAG